jgi:hypothetical protein
MVEALEALGKKDEAQDARWRYFEKTLNADSLRAYLKRLPDFEDFEAERKAFEIAANHRSVDTALEFFVAWPNLQRADEVVREREKELDGGAYYKLRPAAEALGEKYPAGATRLYRCMVESVLHRGSSAQYPYAARDLQSCIRLASRLADDPSLEKHATFMARLQQSHGRKHGFWGIDETMNCGFPFTVGLFQYRSVADQRFPNIMPSIPTFSKSGAIRNNMKASTQLRA